MWRFVAVFGMTQLGVAWFVASGRVQQVAILTAFGVAALLPAVMNPTRSWRPAFWRCVDLVYAGSAVGASIAAHATDAPRLEAFTVSIAPALVFGMLASLGVGRSGLGDIPD